MDLSSTLGGKIAARSGLHESTLKNVSEYWKVVDDAVFAAHPSYLACFITCSLSTLKTDAASFKLDTLPAEILERIASDTSCQDVLALSKVNRTFNRVCYSVHVFKSMIEVGNGYGDANWQCYALTNDDSTATWARYALVDSIARAERRRKGMAMYEPQLMASHHPKFYDKSTKLLALQCYSDSRRAGIKNQRAASFLCLAIRLMMSSTPDEIASCQVPSSGTRGSASPQALQKLRQHLIGRLQQSLRLSDQQHRRWSDGSPMLFFRKYSQVLEAVGIVSVLIREALAKGTVRETWKNTPSPQRPEISVPTTESIYLFDLMAIPLPFAADGPAKIPYCHLATMTSKAFLEEREWEGFCTLSDGICELRIEHPMRGMRFVVSDDPERSWQNLQAYGDDGIGTFSLSGRLASDTGEFRMSAPGGQTALVVGCGYGRFYKIQSSDIKKPENISDVSSYYGPGAYHSWLVNAVVIACWSKPIKKKHAAYLEDIKMYGSVANMGVTAYNGIAAVDEFEGVRQRDFGPSYAAADRTVHVGWMLSSLGLLHHIFQGAPNELPTLTHIVIILHCVMIPLPIIAIEISAALGWRWPRTNGGWRLMILISGTFVLSIIYICSPSRFKYDLGNPTAPLDAAKLGDLDQATTFRIGRFALIPTLSTVVAEICHRYVRS